MSTQLEATGSVRGGSRLADLLANISYEVMPFKSTEQGVLEHLPTEVPLNITVTVANGVDTTLALAEKLHAHGYSVSPHLPARQFVDRAHVADVVARLRDAGISSVFVIGGDASTPAGEFVDALGLLEAIHEVGHPFTEIGIGGYPEGHGTIPLDAVKRALWLKAPLATKILTQICFNAGTTGAWAAGIADDGVGLPVHVGMPGPVNRQKLVRVTAGIGLGQSARFLHKQNGLWRFLLPGGYDPAKFARRLATAAARGGGHLKGLHIFTFNELAGTERWRQELLAAVAERGTR
jgi:methylenetetrahydrofolate reductase (NADPH)